MWRRRPPRHGRFAPRPDRHTTRRLLRSPRCIEPSQAFPSVRGPTLPRRHAAANVFAHPADEVIAEDPPRLTARLGLRKAASRQERSWGASGWTENKKPRPKWPSSAASGTSETRHERKSTVTRSRWSPAPGSTGGSCCDPALRDLRGQAARRPMVSCWRNSDRSWTGTQLPQSGPKRTSAKPRSGGICRRVALKTTA
jgi:hypothetical protein